ncbi:hypothetical protein C0993_008526 [Termitomyces sp. T159_Od127]|nr:hypothetical protein C0993_008526 [Termitomyces sp. T159_Od127]
MDTPPSCCPQPRPIRKTNRPSSQPSGVHTGVVETQQVPNDEEVKAAEALLNFTRHAENLMDQIFCQVMKIPLDEPLGDDEDEEEIEEGQEVDELQSSDSEAEYRENKGKTKEPGQVKPFFISIIDMSAESNGKEAKKIISKKALTDASTSEPPSKEHDLLLKLEAKHMCASCQKPCYVLSSGDHHVFTMQELSTWAFLMSHHKAVIDRPPEELKLEDIGSIKFCAGKKITQPSIPMAVTTLQAQLMQLQSQQLQQQQVH